MGRFVQLSDPHIVVPEKQPVFGNDTIAHLRHAVAAVNRLDPAPDFVVLTGDLTNDEQPASYAELKAALADLRMPCHLALGNHDDRATFRAVMLDESPPSSAPYYYAFQHEGRRFIVLDSHDDGQVSGYIDDEQAGWLKNILDTAPSIPTIVCMHHHPMPIGVDWLDDLMLRNPEALLSILDAHPCVQAVLCGHVHQPTHIQRGHYAIFTTPALSVQFRREPLPPPAERPLSIFSPDPPAFRIVEFKNETWHTTLYTIPLS